MKLLEEKKFLPYLSKLAELGYAFFSLKMGDLQSVITIKKLPYSIFYIEQTVGSGDDGHVYRAKDIATHEVVAIKQYWAFHSESFEANYDTLITRVIEKNTYPITYLEDRACRGANLALKMIGKHPSITQVFYTGIGLKCIEQQSGYYCYNVAFNILEYADQLSAMNTIYPDIRKITRIIRDLYDAQRYFANLHIYFTDNNHGNFLFGNDTLKYTDFESNLYQLNETVENPMYCRMFINIRRHFFTRFLPDIKYNLTLNPLFDQLDSDFTDLCRNDSLCQQRDSFLSRMRNLTNHYAIAMCQDRGETQDICTNRFSFFSNTPDFVNQPEQKRNHHSLAPFFGAIAIQTFRDLLKKLLSKYSVNDKAIDYGINISLALIMIMTQNDAFFAILALMNQALTVTGVLSLKISNILAIVGSFTAGTISAYANGDYHSAMSFATDFSTSTITALLGVICYEGVKTVKGTITDPHFAKTAYCTIL